MHAGAISELELASIEVGLHEQAERLRRVRYEVLKIAGEGPHNNQLQPIYPKTVRGKLWHTAFRTAKAARIVVIVVILALILFEIAPILDGPYPDRSYTDSSIIGKWEPRLGA